MTTTPHPLIEAVRALDADASAALAPALRADVPRALTDADAIALTRAIEALGQQVDAARLVVASELADRSRPERGDVRLSHQYGCANATELLTRVIGVATTTARERIAAARPIATGTALTGDTLPPAFPAVREALLAGQLGYDTVAAITRTLAPIADRCRPGEIAAAETELVAAAIGQDRPACTADETRLQARVWASVLDPDGALPDEERAQRRRALTLGREREGLVRLTGDLLPEVAAQLTRLLHANLSPRVADRAPRFALTAELDTEQQLDPRTRSQKQHDALAAILNVAARSAESPSIGGAPPTLLVTIAAEDLASSTGIAHIDGSETILPARVARHVGCVGGIQRLVLSDDGRIVELGSPQRVFTAAQRRAITARDGGCVIPGCRVPAAWAEIHHVHEHAKGGPTHTDNGVMLCWHHLRTLETSGWTVGVADGVPQVKYPPWIDPVGRWHPASGSFPRQREQLRRRRTG